jgi:hypothetical protein
MRVPVCCPPTGPSPSRQRSAARRFIRAPGRPSISVRCTLQQCMVPSSLVPPANIQARPNTKRPHLLFVRKASSDRRALALSSLLAAAGQVVGHTLLLIWATLGLRRNPAPGFRNFVAIGSHAHLLAIALPLPIPPRAFGTRQQFALCRPDVCTDTRPVLGTSDSTTPPGARRVWHRFVDNGQAERSPRRFQRRRQAFRDCAAVRDFTVRC